MLTIILGSVLGNVLIASLGCDQSLSIAPVSGTITLDGKPLAGATITTQPMGTTSKNPGSGSFGRTDEKGHYALELVTPARAGAIVGEHRVMISPFEGAVNSAPQKTADGEGEYWVDDPQSRLKPAQRSWPTSFTDGSLRLQVPASGKSDANFELKQTP